MELISSCMNTILLELIIHTQNISLNSTIFELSAVTYVRSETRDNLVDRNFVK